jgi:dienelactone hydrolase
MKSWLLLALLPTIAFAKVKTEKVVYEVNGVKMEGVLAFNDKTKKPAPGIVVFHDWMGVGPYSEMRATQLAELGYVAFAADVYGTETRPKDQKEAAEFAAKYRGDRPLLRQRTQAAFDALLKDKRVDKSKVAAIGYCFGGTAALELARSGAPMRGVVSFHGGLASNMKATKFDQRLLILHGADDPFVPEKEVLEFQKEMRDAKADWQFVSYGNAVHSFTQKEAGSDNSKGAAYNELADKRSWKEMEGFFKEIF